MKGSFRHIERHPGYDKVKNPRRLTVGELLPVGAIWDYKGKRIEVIQQSGVLAVPFHDGTGVAIVQGPFEGVANNRAYIFNADGSVRSEITKPTELSTAVFSDVYYAGGGLCFFLSGPSGDFRLSVNESDGTISKINHSR